MKTKLIALLPWKFLALAFAAALGICSTAKAQVHLDFVYDPAERRVDLHYYGTWAINYDPAHGVYNPFISTEARLSSVTLFGGNTQPYSIAPTVEETFDFPMAWNGAPDGTWVSGDVFGFTTNSIYGPAEFTTGTYMSGYAVFYLFNDLSEMGFDAAEILAGSGSHSGAAGTLYWTVTSAVPEPATYAAFLGGAALLICIMRRRGAHG
jgi:hypothetical protein